MNEVAQVRDAEFARLLAETFHVSVVRDQSGRIRGLLLVGPGRKGSPSDKKHFRLKMAFRGVDDQPHAMIREEGPKAGEGLSAFATRLADESFMAPPKDDVEEMATFPRLLEHFGILKGSVNPNTGLPKRPDVFIEARNGIGEICGHKADWDDADVICAEFFGPAIAEFAATLDPRAVAFAEGAEPELFGTEGHGWMDSATWDGIDATFVAGAPLRAALEMFPAHAGSLTNLWKRERSAFVGDPSTVLRTALDRTSKSLLVNAYGKMEFAPSKGLLSALVAIEEKLRKANRLARSELQNLERIAFQTSWGHVPVSPVSKCAVMLGCLPASWTPRDDIEWDAAIRVTSHVLVAISNLRPEIKLDAYLNVKGRWVEFSRRLTVASGGGPAPDYTRIRNAIVDVDDMLRAFDEQVVAPVSENQRYPINKLTSRQMLLSNRSLIRLLTLSTHWHSHRARIDAALVALTPGFGGAWQWPAGLPDCDSEGVEIWVLTDKQELVDEGARGPDRHGVEGLSHCVGGYGERCRSGHSRIVSLRAAGSRLSTAEISVRSRDPDKFSILQHRGAGNKAPPKEAEAALEAYMEALRAGSVDIDIDGLASLPSAGVSDRAGYDVDAPGAWEGAYALWAPYLPRHMRAWSREDVRRFAEDGLEPREEMISAAPLAVR